MLFAIRDLESDEWMRKPQMHRLSTSKFATDSARMIFLRIPFLVGVRISAVDAS